SARYLLSNIDCIADILRELAVNAFPGRVGHRYDDQLILWIYEPSVAIGTAPSEGTGGLWCLLLISIQKNCTTNAETPSGLTFRQARVDIHHEVHHGQGGRLGRHHRFDSHPV